MNVIEEKGHLSLVNRNLDSIPPDESSNTIIHLDLTENHIVLRSAATLSMFPSLDTLILDKNELTQLPSDLPILPSLTTLWLNNNEISDLTILCDSLSKYFPNLSYLSMMRNPACPADYFTGGQQDGYKRYRTYLIYRLKKLNHLDATPVTEEERREAESRGKFLDRIAKPKEDTKEDTNSNQIENFNSIDYKLTPPVIDQKPAAFLGKGKIKYDGRHSEGNRFIFDQDL